MRRKRLIKKEFPFLKTYIHDLKSTDDEVAHRGRSVTDLIAFYENNPDMLDALNESEIFLGCDLSSINSEVDDVN